jgi:hypothetical protein
MLQKFSTQILLVVAASSLIAEARAEVTQDACKDVLTNQVFDRSLSVSDTTFWETYASSTDKLDASEKTSDSGATFGIGDIGFGLTSKDATKISNHIKQDIKDDKFYHNTSSVLLLSGQTNILSAWQTCMQNQGGGITTYFTSIEGRPTVVELHIDYKHNTRGFDGGALKIASDVVVNQSLGIPIEHKDCISKGKTLNPGESCIAKLQMVSAWSSDDFLITFTDGRRNIDFSAYLAPRAVLRLERTSWPTAKMASDWAASHPRVDPINVLSRYGDDTTGSRPWDISAQRDLDDGWFFVEGKQTLSPNKAYVLESDGIVVDRRPGGSATINDCDGGYRVAPTGDRLFIGIGLHFPGPGEHFCNVTVNGTIARLVDQI